MACLVDNKSGKPVENQGIADPRLIAKALDVTDPDPNSHDPKVQDFLAEIDHFESVVPLVEKKLPLSLTSPSLYRIAEQFESKVKALSVPHLIAKLTELEKKAFYYDAKTKEATVVHFEAYFEFKNYLKAIERIAFEDSRYLESVQRQEIFRFTILVSEDLTPKGRGQIYQVEREGISCSQFMELGTQNYLHFLENYDGVQTIFETSDFKEGSLLNEFAKQTWDKEKLARVTQEWAQKNKGVVQPIFEKRLSKEDVSYISKADPKRLVAIHALAMQGHLQTKKPEEKIKTYLRASATLFELVLRGLSVEEIEISFSNRYEELLRGSYGKRLPTEVLQKIKRPLELANRSLETQSRLDNYLARKEFRDAIEETITFELTRPGSPLQQFLNEPFLSAFLGVSVLYARAAKIPFSVSDIFETAKKVSTKLGILIPDPRFVYNAPFRWEDVQELEEITLPFMAYPVTEDPWESEIEILKQIYYRGVSIYELAKEALDTVTFVPYPEKISEHFTAEALAYSLFQNLRISYLDENGDFKPVYKRLGTLAHEMFHNMEFFRDLTGLFPRGSFVSVGRERGAYFFSSYVLKEYLKLRLEKAHEKPLPPEELEEILATIVNNNLAGLSANSLIGMANSTFNPEDRRIELPGNEGAALILYPRLLFDIHPGSLPAALSFLMSRGIKKGVKGNRLVSAEFSISEHELFLSEEKQRIAEEIAKELRIR